MISVELWPLALLEATRISNQVHFTADGRTPQNHFSRTDAMIDLANKHTFRCPVFVLD